MRVRATLRFEIRRRTLERYLVRFAVKTGCLQTSTQTIEM